MNADDFLRALADEVDRRDPATSIEATFSSPGPDASDPGVAINSLGGTDRWEAGHQAGDGSLSAPLDELTRHKIAERAVAALLAPRAEPKLGRGPGQKRRRSARRFSMMTLAAGLLLTAGTLGVWSQLDPYNAPPLPSYRWELRSTVRDFRGPAKASSEQARPRMHPDTRVELVLRPHENVEGELEVRSFLVDSTGGAQPWSPPIEQSPIGVVRIAGSVRKDLGIPLGQWTLVVAIGRPGALPETLDTEHFKAGDGDLDSVRRNDYKILRQPIAVVPAL